MKTGWEEVGPIDDWLKNCPRSLVAFVVSLSLLTVTGPAQCQCCGSFPGGIGGKKRDWELSPPPTVDVLLE